MFSRLKLAWLSFMYSPAFDWVAYAVAAVLVLTVFGLFQFL